MARFHSKARALCDVVSQFSGEQFRADIIITTTTTTYTYREDKPAYIF